jgi:putative membrane protein
MNHIIKIVKGSLVGLGSILPGISGSMVATILKIYTELITALNQFTKKPFKAILSVWQYIVGVLLGYVIGFLLIKVFLENFPIPFTLLFIGFILGSIPSVTPELKNIPKKWHHYAIMILACLMMILFMFVQEQSASTGGWTYYLIVFIIGFITAASLITPGLSAATLLMALGYFHLLISLVDDVLRAILTFNLTEIMPYLPMLLMLALGLLIGLIVIGKVMYQVLMHFKVHFYMAILGIILISPFNILFELQTSTQQNVFDTPWYQWIVGVILFFIGIYTTYKLATKRSFKEDSHD